jgi:hypothetical protein
MYENILISKLVKLRSNVKKIPHFVIKFIPDFVNELEKTLIEADYIVDHDNQKSEGCGKIYRKIGDNKIYFECPIGFGLTAKLTLDFGKKGFKLIVNPVYHKIVRATIDKLYAPGWHLADLIQYSLLEKGYTLLHAGAFQDKDGRATVIFAPPDTGKTFTVLYFLKMGNNYLSEDIGATDGKKFFSCPYTLTSNPLVKELIKGRRKKVYYSIYLKIADVFPLVDRFLDPPIKTMYEVLDRNRISSESDIYRIYILNRGEKENRKLPTDEAITLLLTLNRNEFTYCNNPLLLFSQFNNVKNINIYEKMKVEEEIINKMVNNADHVTYLSGDLFFFVRSIKEDQKS